MRVPPKWYCIVLTLFLSQAVNWAVFMRLEAKLQPNIGNTLRPVLMVFTRSGISPPKMDRFGWNLWVLRVHCPGLALADFGSIHAVARNGESGEIFCQVSEARLYRFSIGQISQNLNTRQSVRWLKLWEQNFVNFPVKRRFFPKTANRKKITFSTSCYFRPP